LIWRNPDQGRSRLIGPREKRLKSIDTCLSGKTSRFSIETAALKAEKVVSILKKIV
jgi:hypothetical protein